MKKGRGSEEGGREGDGTTVGPSVALPPSGQPSHDFPNPNASSLDSDSKSSTEGSSESSTEGSSETSTDDGSESSTDGGSESSTDGRPISDAEVPVDVA